MCSQSLFSRRTWSPHSLRTPSCMRCQCVCVCVCVCVCFKGLATTCLNYTHTHTHTEARAASLTKLITLGWFTILLHHHRPHLPHHYCSIHHHHHHHHHFNFSYNITNTTLMLGSLALLLLLLLLRPWFLRQLETTIDSLRPSKEWRNYFHHKRQIITDNFNCQSLIKTASLYTKQLTAWEKKKKRSVTFKIHLDIKSITCLLPSFESRCIG